MIRPLRRRHLLILIILSLVLPVLFMVGIAARRSIVKMETIPPPLLPGKESPHEP